MTNILKTLTTLLSLFEIEAAERKEEVAVRSSGIGEMEGEGSSSDEEGFVVLGYMWRWKCVCLMLLDYILNIRFVFVCIIIYTPHVVQHGYRTIRICH